MTINPKTGTILLLGTPAVPADLPTTTSTTAATFTPLAWNHHLWIIACGEQVVIKVIPKHHAADGDGGANTTTTTTTRHCGIDDAVGEIAAMQKLQKHHSDG